MMHRRSLEVAAASAAVVVPVAAFAQGPTGTVTIDPVRLAPALGMPLLAALVAVMAGLAIYRLRRPLSGPIVGFALVAAVAALAGLAYAVVPTVIISGVQCTQRTTVTFEALVPAQLMSECANPIQIVAIELSCAGSVAPGTIPPITDCSTGQVLHQGDDCLLPVCGT